MLLSNLPSCHRSSPLTTPTAIVCIVVRFLLSYLSHVEMSRPDVMMAQGNFLAIDPVSATSSATPPSSPFSSGAAPSQLSQISLKGYILALLPYSS